MIAAYHGKTDYSAAELLAVNPFAPACKPLRCFGGVTARLDRARGAAIALRAIPIRFHHKG
jgi:hypothetical protein